jgi:hypothetical protein
MMTVLERALNVTLTRNISVWFFMITVQAAGNVFLGSTWQGICL